MTKLQPWIKRRSGAGRTGGVGGALLAGVVALIACGPAWGQTWRSLPPLPPMPTAAASGFAPVNGIQMYYAVYGRGRPLLLIHNGLGDANDWAGVVPPLARDHRVIVADTRGFGRSTRDQTPYSYGLLAGDYLALLSFLKIDKVVLVGNSDGGVIGLDIAIHHPDRLAGLFIHGANATRDGVDYHPSDLTAIRLAVARSHAEYARLSSTPADYAAFQTAVGVMDAKEPDYTEAELRTIATPTVVAFSDHEESITRAHTEFLARAIPGARMVVLTGVSHFAPLQDPEQFANAVLAFVGSLPPERPDAPPK